MMLGRMSILRFRMLAALLACTVLLVGCGEAPAHDAGAVASSAPSRNASTPARPDRPSVVFLGDSLTSDIAGGHNAGIDTCWYNRHGAPRPEGTQVTHEITELGELPAIVNP